MNRFKLLLATMLLACGVTFAQLQDEEYSYVTMDLQGILDLTMTTNPQVDFSFTTISDYVQGITQYNAVQLEVDATVAWDLYVFTAANAWTQVEAYSTNGEEVLPVEILQIASSVTNAITDGAGGTDGVSFAAGTFQSLLSQDLTTATASTPTTWTQFLGGGKGLLTADGTFAEAPGTAAANPSTHKFRMSYKIAPGIPANFPAAKGTTFRDAAGAVENFVDATGDDGDEYAQAGYYYLEVVYALVEDI